MKSNFIDEYKYYTKNVNEGLKRYIEEKIFPQYAQNDYGHRIAHIKEVIKRSFVLRNNLKLDLKDDMIYAISACHDWGKYEETENGEKHGIIAGRKFMEDQKMITFFDDEERLIIKEAIEDHSHSLVGTPRSKYGELISSADRNTKIENVFIRTFFSGKFKVPNMSVEEYLDFIFKRLAKRYSEENLENMYLEDEIYRTFLKKMRALLQNEVKFKKKYCEVNHIKSKANKLADELGAIEYFSIT